MSSNKIYSRPRIRFRKNYPKTRRQKIKILIWFVLCITVIAIIVFIKAAYPIFIATCNNAATSTAVNILNDTVNEVMIMYNYDDLVTVRKDEYGNVSYIEAKAIAINQLISVITSNVQSKLDSSSMIIVNLNFGSVSGISALYVISPQFKIALERAGDIETKVNSEFTSVGINQTLHRIYLKLSCTVGILTPFQSLSKTVESEVLLSETVIVGSVPDTYYNYDNLGFEDVIQTIK